MRAKIRDRSSATISPANNLKYVLTQDRRATQKTWMATLVMSLGLAGGLWFTFAAHIGQIAQAQTVSYDVNIDRQPNESYENLVKRAEAAARAAISNNLVRNRQGNDVSITVVAHNRGAIAPVLNLKVSRNQEFNSNPNNGITYFSQARSLLRLDEDLATTPAGSSNNTNPRSGLQPRFNNPTTSRSGQNSDPGTVKQGIGNGNSTFSQPGRVVTPSTTGQTTNTTPSSSTGTANPGISAGQTSPNGTGLTPQSSSQTTNSTPSTTGTGLTPQSPSTTPINSPGQTTNSTGSTTGTVSPQSPSTTPINSPSQTTNSTPSTTGTGLTPQAPSTGQPLLTPSTPSSTNSNNGSPSVNTSPNNGTTNTTVPGIVPSSQPR